MIRHIHSLSPVRKRLNSLLALVLLSGLISILGATEISKGAHLLSLNYQHIAEERQLSNLVEDLEPGDLRANIARLQQKIRDVQKFSQACLDALNLMDRAILKGLGNGRIITLCEDDVALADRMLETIEGWSTHPLDPAGLLTAMMQGTREFRENSDAFQPLVVSSERIIYWSVLALLLFKALLIPAIGLKITQQVNRDYGRLEMAEETVRQSRDEAVRASRLRDEFVANLSHELRTPLNPIIGMSEALADGLVKDTPESRREYLMDINQSARHLLELLNRTFDWEKLKRGQFTVVLEPHDLDRLIRSTLAERTKQAEDRRVTLIYDPEYGQDPTALIDTTACRQILSNLLGNAIKFTNAGTEVRVTLTRQEETLTLTITDHGPGIPEDQMTLVADAFYRRENPHIAPETEGLGLGLALVTMLAQATRATFAMKNRPGGGLHVTVRFPAA
ncbi:sensor histidine kinase [Yunchengibacter salinarum]|uniref:sensor histidine kinase n=1 Tax=Yunchengibacter salinarum TaxID=3133399 RepID=UPI0035B69332